MAKRSTKPQIGLTGSAALSVSSGIVLKATVLFSAVAQFFIPGQLVKTGQFSWTCSGTLKAKPRSVDTLSFTATCVSVGNNNDTLPYLINNIAIVRAGAGAGGGSGGIADISIYDEGGYVGQVDTLDFVGATVSARITGPKRAEIESQAGTGTASFLPAPDLIDLSDGTYLYYGWENVNGGWLIRRNLRSTAEKYNATIAFNIYADLSAAWSNRVNLIYV